jgi:hypothetical protein
MGMSETDLSPLGGRRDALPACVQRSATHRLNARCRFRFRGHWRPTHNEPSKRRLKADFVNFDPSDIFPLVTGHRMPSK